MGTDAEKDVEGEDKLDGVGVGNDVPMEPRGHGNGHWKGKERDSSAEGEGSGSGGGGGHANGKHANAKLNPEEYQHARKRLKKAVLEYYRWVFPPLFYYHCCVWWLMRWVLGVVLRGFGCVACICGADE